MGVSLIIGFGNGVFEVGHVAINVVSMITEVHESACIANQHSLIPFAFDTFGFLAHGSVEVLKRLQKVMGNNVMTAGATEYVFRRVAFAIQKVLVAQLVACLSSTFT